MNFETAINTIKSISDFYPWTNEEAVLTEIVKTGSKSAVAIANELLTNFDGVRNSGDHGSFTWNCANEYLNFVDAFSKQAIIAFAKALVKADLAVKKAQAEDLQVEIDSLELERAHKIVVTSIIVQDEEITKAHVLVGSYTGMLVILPLEDGSKKYIVQLNGAVRNLVEKIVKPLTEVEEIETEEAEQIESLEVFSMPNGEPCKRECFMCAANAVCSGQDITESEAVIIEVLESKSSSILSLELFCLVQNKLEELNQTKLALGESLYDVYLYHMHCCVSKGYIFRDYLNTVGFAYMSSTIRQNRVLESLSRYNLAS